MRRCLSWVICGALWIQVNAAIAQHSASITPNYGRPVNRVAVPDLPPLTDTTPVGSGLKQEEIVIPQQGSVDMGTPSSHPRAAYEYSPFSTSVPQGADSGCDIDSCCSSCGSSDCVGGCQQSSFKGTLGKKHSAAHHGGWFGGVYYMHLWRGEDTVGEPLVFDSANPMNTVLGTGSARMSGDSALGIRLGKMRSPSSAVEFIYWQTFADDVTAVADASVVGAPVSSNIDFGSLTYDNLGGGGGVPVNDFFTDAQYISLTRSFDYRNFELNFLKLPFVFGADPNSRARLALLAGVRYFHAAEDLELFGDDFNSIVGDDPANELRLQNELDNFLVGFQLGCLFDWQFAQGVSGQIGSKAGIYNNRMTHVQSVNGGAGGATIGTGAFAGQFYGLDTEKDDVAFLAEFDAGLAYCLNANWRLTGGYKILGISGYAAATRQIPRSYDNVTAAGLIHNEDSLILHGVYAGAEFCW